MRANSDRLDDDDGTARSPLTRCPPDGGFVDRVVLAVGLLVATIVLSGVVIAAQIHDRTTTAWERDSAAEAERAAAEVVGSANRSIARLAGADRLVTDDGIVAAARFVAFAETLAVDVAIVGTALNLVVSDAERADFEARYEVEISDRDAAGDLEAAAERPLYVPVAAVAPISPRTAQTLGLDHLQDPTRGETLRQAWTGTVPVVSEPVTLVSGRRGFLVAQALRGRPDDAIAAPVGFVVVAFDVEALVRQAERRTGAEIVSVTLDGLPLHGSSGDPARPTVSIAERVATTTWSVEVVVDERPSIALPAAVVVVAILLAGVFATVFVLVRRNEGALGRLAAVLQQENARGDELRRLSELLSSAHEPHQVADVATTAGHLVGADWLRVTVLGDDRRPLATAGDEGFPPDDADVLELTTGDGNHGTLVVSPPAAALDDIGRAVRMTTVNLVASAAARTKRQSDERELASSLQRMFLPRLPERIPLGTACGVYRPMTTSQVGGDWYDAISDGVVGTFVIGDIVGKGIRAAGAMGNLRIATRMVDQGIDVIMQPHVVLAALDEVANEVPDTFLTTMAVVVADREAREIRVARAGHLPPVILTSGVAELVDEGLGPPLGLRPPDGRHSARRPWDGPMRIVLYTDGLVERRRQSLDDNIERLRRLVEAHADCPLPELAQLIPDEMEALGPQEDDIALLLIDLSPPEPAQATPSTPPYV